MNKTADRTVELGKGRMDIYTASDITLYAYQTRDAIEDEVFILTRAGRGVVIELPCFYDNIRELTAFLEREGITVEGKLVAYHAAGGSFLPRVPAYGTASSVAYNTTGGGAAEMKEKVQAKYPAYSGMNYLDMTVGFFFPNK